MRSTSGTNVAWSRFSVGALYAPLFGATVAWSGAADLFDEVVRQARIAAQTVYQPNESALPLLLRQLNYDTYRDITFRRDRALWHKTDEPFEVQFFHPGYLFTHSVRLHEAAKNPSSIPTRIFCKSPAA